MDARKMEYVPEQCFDLVLDKALFDAMVCSENNIRDIEAYLKEIYRVLKTGGVFVIVSHGAPGRRMNLLQPHLPNMEIEVQEISKYMVKGCCLPAEERHFISHLAPLYVFA